MCMVMMTIPSIPALASNSYPNDNLAGSYYVLTDKDLPNLGKATSIEPITTVEAEDTFYSNKSKDAALIPPSFGTPSADLPGSGEYLTPNRVTDKKQAAVYTATVSSSSNISGGAARPPAVNSTVTSPNHAFTLPSEVMNDDESLGWLSIPKYNIRVKVYETESLESLSKGIGHFKFTSAWNGNVGFAGHNRGINTYFGQIHHLTKGDNIIYQTKYGTRIYEVVTVQKIKATDYSYLERTVDNRVTLITCVANQPDYRWCVQAMQR